MITVHVNCPACRRFVSIESDTEEQARIILSALPLLCECGAKDKPIAIVVVP